MKNLLIKLIGAPLHPCKVDREAIVRGNPNGGDVPS
jgi:hypothetical protein